MKNKKKKKGFPDLNKDGKVTFKDILIGRGVIKKNKGGSLKGGQKKLDANKDGKISGEDFAMLRNKKPVKAVTGEMVGIDSPQDFENLPDLNDLPEVSKPITQNERRQQIIRDRSTKKILDQLRTPAMRLDPRKKMGGGMMNEDPMGYKSGGAIEVGKGKDYIKDLL